MALYTRRKKNQPKKPNTVCVGHHYTQSNTNNVNKTWAFYTINPSNSGMTVIIPDFRWFTVLN